VREVQVAYRIAERRACSVLRFSERLAATGAGVIRGPSFAFDVETWRRPVALQGLNALGAPEA
jgi:hypothetical protein